MAARKMSLRRAFTLLEVTLATAIGGMVILVSLSLLVSMEKLERPLATRQQELADLHRTRTVIQRAISSLVMSDTTAPINPNQRRTNSSAEPATTTDEKSAFEATAEATANKQQQQQRPPARLLLESDQTDDLKASLQAVGVPVDSASGIQRLELVIDSPPIAPNFRAELGDAIAATYARNTGGNLPTGTSSQSGSSGSNASSSGLSRTSNASDASTMTTRDALNAQSGNGRRSRNLGRGLGANAGQAGAQSGSLRGAFEIRPMMSAENQADRRDGRPVLYQLWWTPLPAAKDTSKLSAATNAPVSQKEDDPRTLEAWGEPVLLANNLVKCRWKLFSSGEQRMAHNAVWERELPAYVEFEIQTKTGLYENWMFEVGWSKGAELVSRDDTVANGGGALGIDGAGNGGGAGLGQNGQNGQPGQGGPNGGPGPHHGGPQIPPHINPTGPNSGGPRYDTLPTKPK